MTRHEGQPWRLPQIVLRKLRQCTCKSLTSLGLTAWKWLMPHAAGSGKIPAVPQQTPGAGGTGTKLSSNVPLPPEAWTRAAPHPSGTVSRGQPQHKVTASLSSCTQTAARAAANSTARASRLGTPPASVPAPGMLAPDPASSPDVLQACWSAFLCFSEENPAFRVKATPVVGLSAAQMHNQEGKMWGESIQLANIILGRKSRFLKK